MLRNSNNGGLDESPLEAEQHFKRFDIDVEGPETDLH